ncbi:unnamed protein product [Peronospora belbahrii]|uniref:Trafficking protein particle complex subunit 11 domain-containing protein n=1 Tax=Peronospora belbahrii TaxID=622444 RepID=A0AAU9L3M8_9STRA|nr:unnamed protein product [Peronospora belbahrii]
MDTFQLECFQCEEELRQLDTKRRARGWNVGAFLHVKEKLALMYQQMYLKDDAIRHLDELDAIFINLNETEKQVLQDSSKIAFECHDPIFTQSPLALDLDEIQQYIASNRASARLISLYCFCRQIRTLYIMGSFLQLLKRASLFIESFLAELDKLAAEGEIKWHQPFLWALGACMEISYACEVSWSGRDDEWTASSVSVQAAQAIPAEEMSRALGNILYLARRVLKKFAKSRKCRNEHHVLSSSLSDAADAETSMTWYQKLEQVFVSPEWQQSETCDSYERCLSEISHLASMHFLQCGRHRFAVYLEGECAQYHYGCGEFEVASRLLRSLARQSEEDGWWTIFGACVQRICRAELALGQSTQRISACFNMLQLAQEELFGVSKEGMKQLLIALVASFESNDGADKVVNSVKDMKKSRNVPKINLGDLFRPSMAVETTQTSAYVLKHGDICVTLGIANEFPAGVELEKVCVCFSRMVESYESFAQEELSHIDDLELSEATRTDASVDYDKSNVLGTNLVSTNDSNRPSKSDDVIKNVHIEHEQDTELLLEKWDVYLDEKTGANLVWRHSGVPVGRYICSGIECVIAGNTFHLLPSSALVLASFEITAKESTVQVDIDGAPLLVPQPLSEVETITVSVRANDDMVVNGILELRVCRRIRSDNCITRGNEKENLENDGSSCNEECRVHLIKIQQLGETGPDTAASLDNVQSNHVESRGELNSLLSVALPTVLRGDSLRYVVTVMVPPLNSTESSFGPEDENEDITNVTIRASVRYQRDRMHTSARTTATEMHCTESTFRVLQPLTEVVQLRRVGTKIFASITLVCNPFLSVVLQDYHLQCPGQVGNASVHCPVVTVEQDPNTKLRGTNLRPNDRVHLAFTLGCSPAFETKACDSYCSLALDLKYGADKSWFKTMAVHVPLAEVEGKHYRIDVLPRGLNKAYTFLGEIVEATANEPVTFDIHVQEEVSHLHKAVLADDTNTLSLCLNQSSEYDWILVGKQRERFNWNLYLGNHGDRRREFRTQKRLLATRSGLLRFPGFHLQLNDQTIPAARVHCQQSSRQVIVS